MFPPTNNNPSAVRLLSDKLIPYFMSRWGESRICGVFIWRIRAAALRRVGVTSASPSVAFRGGPCRRSPQACRDSGDTARSLRWTWRGSKADIGCSAPAPPKRLWIKLPRTPTDLEKELSKTRVYSPGCRTLSSPWMVSLCALQRVSGIKTWGEQSGDAVLGIYSSIFIHLVRG